MAKQFKAAYKRLLMHTSVTGSTQVNCIEQTPSIILAMSTTNTVKMKTDDHQLIDNFITDENNRETITSNHDYTVNTLSFSNIVILYVCDVVDYIAGFVVKKVKKTFKL
uniref:Uncharacterized protein LOC114346026 n=1 Tax=Diabrotica virgifera virgifera TaxID=50390 RepID=A0A6P7H4N0_DIAVI